MLSADIIVVGSKNKISLFSPDNNVCTFPINYAITCISHYSPPHRHANIFVGTENNEVLICGYHKNSGISLLQTVKMEDKIVGFHFMKHKDDLLIVALKKKFIFLQLFENKTKILKIFSNKDGLATSAMDSCVDGNCHFVMLAFSQYSENNKQAFTELQSIKIVQDSIILDHNVFVGNLPCPLEDIHLLNSNFDAKVLFFNQISKVRHYIEENTSLSLAQDYKSWFPPMNSYLKEDTFKRILKSRTLSNGDLFIDKLLDVVKIPSEKFYPPKSYQDLLTLVDSIGSNDYSDQLQKLCLLYYLMKDTSQNYAQFADHFLIPLHFRILMDGYWALDHQKFEVNGIFL